MNGEYYIISSCTISKNVVVKNEQQISSLQNGNLQSFLIAVYHQLKIDYPKFYKMDNLCKLGFLASEILLKDENMINEIQPAQTGIVLSNKNSSLDTDIKYFQTTKEMPSPALFVYTLPNILPGEICIRNNFKGETACFVFEDFDEAFIEQYVNDLFNQNILQLCICGWVDVLDENYKACLFLVSKNNENNALTFTKENMNALFKNELK